MAAELEFVRALISIGKKLGAQPTKEAKTSRLLAELSILNLNLPARVYLPLSAIDSPHHIVRIPPQAAVVLNSKDKVKFQFSINNYQYFDNFFIFKWDWEFISI